MIQKSDTAIFPGSFNPFTIGHASIVERGLGIFSRIIIAIGENISKDSSERETRLEAIRELYSDEPRVEVISYHGLTAELARERNAVILRGVRSMNDFESERTLADINRRIAGIETVLLYSLPEMESISSSMVRELHHFGADITPYIPKKK